MTFITVNYGDNEHEIFNPNCPSQVLLDSIRRKCTANESASIVDLSDAEANIKHLNENLTMYASVYLEGRGSYWLVKIETASSARKGLTDQDPDRYSLMVTDPEETCPELTSRLRDLSKPQSKSRKDGSSWSSLKKRSMKGTKGATSGRTSRGSASTKGKK